MRVQVWRTLFGMDPITIIEVKVQRCHKRMSDSSITECATSSTTSQPSQLARSLVDLPMGFVAPNSPVALDEHRRTQLEGR